MEKSLSKNKKLALTGAFSALIVVLGITRLGFISLSPTVSLTIIHIPVILVVMLAGLPGGLACGTVFGIFSLIQAAMNPSGALDPLFVNPLISIVPRILFALVTWFFWKLLNFIPHMPKTISAAITSFTGSLLHTCFVIGMLYLFYNGKVSAAMGGLGYISGLALLLPNALIEAAAASVVCTAVIATITFSGKKHSKLSQETGSK